MQQPTLQNVRIRSTRDALQVFYGVATNRLRLITRRLDAEERRAIVPGNVYVWEERGANTEPTGLGMERWTDGMGWGPSRVRDEFLFYHQKDSDAADDAVNPVTPWAQMMRRRERMSSRVYASSSAQEIPEPERLIKQTYSVHVSLGEDRLQGIVRKWHLTAYFSQKKLDDLDTVDVIRGVGDVPVPEGLFRSARAGKPRRDGRSMSVSSSSQAADSHLESTPPHGHALPSPSRSHFYEVTPSARAHHPQGGSISPVSPNQAIRFPPYPSPQSHSSPGQLVPLEYLERISCPRRDPADEQLLRRFHSRSVGSSGSVNVSAPRS